MKQLIFLLMCFMCLSSNAQTDADDWKVYPVPKNEDTLNAYSQKGIDWMVYSNDGKVFIKEEPKANEMKLPFVLPPARFGTKKYPGQKAFIAVDDGYLVSFTGGEYGDKLFWYSKNGQENYIVSKQVVLQFITRDEKLFAIEATETGNVIEIKKQGDKWVTAQSAKLPFVPDAIGMDGNKNFIIVTTDNLVQVAPDGTIKTLLKEGFWSILLFPNSLVVKGDDVFIGMRKGVFKYNVKTGKQEWLMKD